ncbi:hypothetical protein [Tissierella praeacuta]|uniref:hypothetical protein n=1 Tax=Tissierella praeacuta TaxID=43131 RepID=UPI00333F7EDB
MNEKLSRILLEIAIDRGLVEIESKSKRSIRNLIDLGDHFAKGKSQKNFYNIAQKVLANENSPYYELIFHTVKNVDHNILKTFGINIGFNSWTYGAKRIRQYETEKDCNVPWTIVFDFTKSVEDKLSSSKLFNIIKEGKDIGIYTYFFFLDDNKDKLRELIELFRLNQNCAFILFVNSNILEEESISKLKNIGNSIISINMKGGNSDFNSKIDFLKKNKILFGVHMIYYDNDTKTILKDDWINDVISLNCTFAFLIPAFECNNKNVDLISKYIKDTKTNQKYPIFIIDFFKDIAHVNKIISTESYLIKILNNDTVILSYDKNIESFNINNINFSEIFSKIIKKVNPL